MSATNVLEQEIAEAGAPAINLDSKVQEIEQFLTSRPDISANQLSKMANVSSSTLSGLRNGKYDKRSMEHVERFLTVIEQERAKLKYKMKRPGFVPTSVYSNICYIAELARADAVRNIMVVYGQSGIGKTESLRYYLDQHKSDILISVNSKWNDSTILRKLGEALSLGTTGAKDKVFDLIVNALRGTGRAIWVDEADYLSLSALDVLRRIYDEAEVPMLLVGLPRLRETISAGRKGFEQIARRMWPQYLPGIKKHEAENIVRAIFPDVSQELVDFITSSTRENIAYLIDLMVTAQKLLLLNKEASLSLHVLKMAKEQRSWA